MSFLNFSALVLWQRSGLGINALEEIRHARHLLPLRDDPAEVFSTFLNRLLDLPLVFFPSVPLYFGEILLMGDFSQPVRFL